MVSCGADVAGLRRLRESGSPYKGHGDGKVELVGSLTQSPAQTGRKRIDDPGELFVHLPLGRLQIRVSVVRQAPDRFKTPRLEATVEALDRGDPESGGLDPGATLCLSAVLSGF